MLLFHCIESFPASTFTRISRPSIQFALIPALHLAAIATKTKELLIAYKVIEIVIEDQGEDEQRQTALLLVNTIRQYLESTLFTSPEKGKERQTEQSINNSKSSVGITRVTLALRSVIAGVPTGPDIFPALYSPISRLCHHSDERIQSLALDALGQIQSYLDYDDSLSRAIWERVHSILANIEKKKNGKGKAISMSLKMALLRAIRRAVDQNVLGRETACELAYSLVDLGDSPTSSIACVKLVADMAARGPIGQTNLVNIRIMLCKICLVDPKNYSILLSAAQILGKLALVDSSSTSSRELKSIWALVKGHLGAKNGNRKLLVLSVLESLLPYRWFEGGNAAEIELEEVEMGTLMSMLGDRDESIRFKVSFTVDTCLLT